MLKMVKVLQKSRKHCGKRRNCSLRAISSFPHNVFNRLVLQTRKNKGLFGKGLRWKNLKIHHKHFSRGIVLQKELAAHFFLPFSKTFTILLDINHLSASALKWDKYIIQYSGTGILLA